jgi:hypothetical protein
MVLSLSVFLAVIVAVRIHFPVWVSCDVYSGLVAVTFQPVQSDYGHSLVQFPQASCTPRSMVQMFYFGYAKQVQRVILFKRFIFSSVLSFQAVAIILNKNLKQLD